MDVVFGVSLFLAAAAVTLWSVQITRTAEPDRRIPQVRPTLRRPTSATFLQVVGTALSLFSAFLLLDALGPFAALAPALVATAWMMAAAEHNRELDRQSQPEALSP